MRKKEEGKELAKLLKWNTYSVFLVGLILIATVVLMVLMIEQKRRSMGLTHYDRVQMDRLVNSLQ